MLESSGRLPHAPPDDFWGYVTNIGTLDTTAMFDRVIADLRRDLATTTSSGEKG